MMVRRRGRAVHEEFRGSTLRPAPRQVCEVPAFCSSHPILTVDLSESVDAAMRWERDMRRAFVVVASLLVAAEVIQFYFAAFGVFQAPAGDDQFLLHQMNGRMVLPLLCLLVILAAALARAPGRLIGFSAIPFGLLLLQVVLFVLAGLTGSTEVRTTLAGTIILGLHAINGLAILGVTILLVRRAARWAAAGARPVADAPAQAPARS